MSEARPAARTYNQNHVARKYTRGKRRLSIYWTWSYPWETQRDPAEMTNRFSTMTEVRNVLWPAYETPEWSAAQFLQGGSGLFTVERDRFVSTDRQATRQSKDVVDAAGPGQRVVGEIAFPAAGMMDAECANLWRPDDIGDGAIQDEPQVEVSRLLAKRPTLEHRRH